jgi:ribonuclease Z
MDVTFLGTGASVPSRDSSVSCIAIRDGADITLFDCGEGSQRQLMISPLSYMKIVGIFITHMHGDHVLGLPGLLQTMGLAGRTAPLRIFGPVGFRKSIESFLEACEGTIPYPLEIIDMGKGEVAAFEGHIVFSFAVDHGVPALGYIYKQHDARGRFDKAKALSLGLVPGPEFNRLQAGETVKGIEPSQVIGPPRTGVSVAYTGDTAKSAEVARAVRGCDLLIHESTYASAESELASAHKHSTCVQAAEVAAEAEVGALVLTHISNRYDDRSLLLDEAKAVFPETLMASDMLMLNISKKGIRSV